MVSHKSIVYSTHARTSASERNIDPRWVERAVFDLDCRESDRTRPEVERLFKVIPEFGDRVLRVVAVETSDEIRIVTAFFDRRARHPI